MNTHTTHYFFCPNPNCSYHSQSKCQDEIWYYKKGHHHTRAFGLVRRYQCKACKRSFSDQTFSLNYYLKRQTDFKQFSFAMNSTSSYNYIGRQLKLSANSIRIRCDRLGRNGIFMMASVLGTHLFSEQLVADGFETYSYSKYFPVIANILTGASSEFIYYLNLNHQKRKGRMSTKQVERVKSLYQGKSFHDSKLRIRFTELLSFIKDHHPGCTLRLDTDEHPMYAYLIKKYNAQSYQKAGLIHRQTNSKVHRDMNNLLFSVNYIDRLFRKDLSEHRRKGTCPAQNDNNMSLRFWHYIATHNFYKPHRIHSGAYQSRYFHYEYAGIPHIKVEPMKRVFFTHRFFKSKVILERQMDCAWRQEVASPHHQGKHKVPKFCLEMKEHQQQAA